MVAVVVTVCHSFLEKTSKEDFPFLWLDEVPADPKARERRKNDKCFFAYVSGKSWNVFSDQHLWENI